MDRATIINSMLSVVGESGVSATTSTHPSVQAADRILKTTDVDFQQTGWWFNRDYKLKLVPNSEGRVAVPASALECTIWNVEALSPTEKLRYSRRGNFIYDAIKHTDVINTLVYVNIVTQLPIDSLPSQAGSYLLHKAREGMCLADDADSFKLSELQKETGAAWAKLSARKLQIEATNALDNPVARELLSGIGSGWSRNPNLIGGRYR